MPSNFVSDRKHARRRAKAAEAMAKKARKRKTKPNPSSSSSSKKAKAAKKKKGPSSVESGGCLVEKKEAPCFFEVVRRDRNHVLQIALARSRLREEIESAESESARKYELEEELRIAQRVMPLSKFEQVLVPFVDEYYRLDQTGTSEQQLIAAYKREVGLSVDETEVLSSSLITSAGETCRGCGSNSIVRNEDEATFCCAECGQTTSFIEATSGCVAYGDEVDFSSSSFSYRPINHLNEFLNRFQVKETTRVPSAVMRRMMTYLFEVRGLRSVEELTFAELRRAQKALRLSKYYSQAMQMWCRLTGKAPMRLRPIVEDRMRIMFLRVKSVFNRFVPEERKNFLSYPYCIFKFCQLLNVRDMLPYLSLLKGADKLKFAEEVFERICKHLGWKFVPIPRTAIVDDEDDGAGEEEEEEEV
jgi:hypothetical protein